MGEAWTRRQFLATGGTAVAGSYLLGPQTVWAASSWSPAGGRRAPEDGYELWLRYRLVDRPRLLASYRRAFTEIVRPGNDAVLRSAEAELVEGLSALLGKSIETTPFPSLDGAVVLGTPDTSSIVRDQIPSGVLAELGREGFVLRRGQVDGLDVVLVASEGARGVLYGAFHLLRLLQTQRDIEQLDVAERPANPLRLANHWDNLDRTVERGYAGLSIFHWDELPETRPRYADYARALASVGMNGTVVNSVNANAQALSSQMIHDLVPLAEVLRGWGVTLYLSANFASPMRLGGPPSADPLDPDVRAWWASKADEIYSLIPDFGGFLVKASSEGQPGPLEYGRTHAEGANMLAEAVGPHGGIIMWRAFMGQNIEVWAREQYDTFEPLDGHFADNVVLQIKNGPIDFQIREPVHPLFGGLPKTNSMLELQITQEYTGQATHLCYLVPMWKEVYDFDTHAEGTGTTVASIVDGSAYGYAHGGVAGVMNFGSDPNWTGHHLAAANTHGYGRLAWNPALSAEEIADEWVRMTFSSHAQTVQVLSSMLLSSREIYESYNSPLGAGFIQGSGDHFDPCPECNTMWHQSDGEGIGFDRTVATGTGTVGLYHPPVSEVFESLETCPDELLLFAHHVPYTHRLHSGKTVIQHIYDSHFEGVDDAHRLRRLWQAQKAQIDARRHSEVQERFDRQVEHATSWRDSLVAYWFADSRILDQLRSWVQAKFSQTPPVLLDGWPNLVQLSVGNASPGDLEVTAALKTPENWTTNSAPTVVTSREVADVAVTVRPSAPDITTIQTDADAGGLEVLSASTEVIAAAAGQRCVLALDAGTPSSPLLASYRRLTPADLWDPAKGYGWVGAEPQSRDRGIPDALRRDFVNDIPTRTLRVAVPAGAYDTHMLVGDALNPGAYPTYVHSGGELLAESEFQVGGEFSWLQFSLDGGARGREIDLELSSVPGEHWHLVALAIVDPNADVPSVVVTGVDVDALMWGGRDHTATVHVANTTTAEDLWVTADVAAPDGWSIQDASASVAANAHADLVMTLTPDLTPLITELQVEVEADGREGRDVQLIGVMAVPPGDRVALALDAGLSNSPLLETYQRLSPEHGWDAEKGYGWVGPAPQARDRGGLDALRRDFVNDVPARVLRVAVPPGGHDVYLLVGDTLPSAPTYVRSDGELVARSEPWAGGEFTWLQFTLDGGDNGREVDLELASDAGSHWHLNALVIR